MHRSDLSQTRSPNPVALGVVAFTLSIGCGAGSGPTGPSGGERSAQVEACGEAVDSSQRATTMSDASKQTIARQAAPCGAGAGSVRAGVPAIKPVALPQE